MPEVEVHDAVQPAAELRKRRVVQMELCAHASDHLGRGVCAAGKGDGGIPGHERQQHEHTEGHEQQDRDEGGESA